ncbi:MAG: thiamine pyrophosphate-dependent enzyme [Rhodospirillales bacterium]|nr:thiamine pyrophosphate-dependent enzyme [Rhodospirillales bacterium]
MTELTNERRRDLFERMLVMRRFEESVATLSKEHSFGHFHLYIGEEATGAGAIEALEQGDLTTSTHRNHGHIVGRGADVGGALAEIMGREGGLNGGFGGTLHLTDRESGFLSTSAVVGGSIGLATGAGFGLKRQAQTRVAMGFFGDAAMEEGIAFESLNLAKIWSLPVIYICENNSRGALGSSAGEFTTSSMATGRLSNIPESVGITSEVVDGADPEAVFAAVSAAVAHARNGEGPAFIEAMTERWPGSRPLWPKLSTGITDLAAAWDESLIGGEHGDWISNHDPILSYARALSESHGFEQARLMEIDQQVLTQMETASAFAVASPLPDPSIALGGVFAGGA